MKGIEIFKNDRFGEVRVAWTSENPLFCLADVCRVLEIKNPSDCKSRLKKRRDSFNRGGLKDYKSVWYHYRAGGHAHFYKRTEPLQSNHAIRQAASRTIPRLGMWRGSPFHPQTWSVYDKRYIGKGIDLARFLDPIGHKP